MVGLGRMGANMTRRLMRGGHEVVVHDRSTDAVAAAVADGAIGCGSLAELVGRLGDPGQRAVWVMVPAGAPTAETLDALGGLLTAGDVVVDGGNSRWKDTQARAEALAGRGNVMVDAGTSGGGWGLQNGYCLMVGGARAGWDRIEPALRTLAPEGGLVHVDERPGAGHFVKMVHNGIEYAMMQAYAEGFEIMEKSPFAIDHATVADVWGHGSVVRSWLLELLAGALAANPELEGIRGYVDDSGEGRWSVDAAVEFGAPAYTIAASLFARFASREDDAFGLKMLAVMRNAFGGHAVRKD